MEVETVGGRGASYDRDKLKQQLGSSKGGSVKAIDIKHFQGKTLEEIEGVLRNRKREQLVILDANDNPVRAYQGDANSVNFPITELQVENATVTHGHPKGVEEFGGTFSFADVGNMAQSKWKEHRATASGQGEMNYILRKNSNATPRKLKALYDKISKDENKVMANAQKMYIKTKNDALKSGKTKIQARHLARQEAVGVIDRYWQKTLPSYGIDYIKRKKDYRYGR